jgi:hypothetical protein
MTIGIATAPRAAAPAASGVPNKKAKGENMENPKSQIPNSKSQIRNPKPQIRNPKSQIQNHKSEIPNPKSQIPNLKLGISIIPKLNFGFRILDFLWNLEFPL